MTLPEFIQKALGAPFKPKGRDYPGWDCFGPFYCAYRDILGIQMPSYVDDYVDPGDTLASRRVIQDMILAEKHKWNLVTEPKALDVVLFRFGDTQTHLGLMVDSKQFLHCEKKIGTVIERVDSAKWKSRVEGIYRLKDSHE
jgi:cell wall-associated NlpC family hydrolase